MRTKTLKIALYECVPGGVEIVLVGAGDSSEGTIRVSEFQDVEFQVVDDSSCKDAIKALKIKAAQDRINAAQAELDALL